MLHKIYYTITQHKALRGKVPLNTIGTFGMVDGEEILEEMAQNSCSLNDSTGLSSLVHQ